MDYQSLLIFPTCLKLYQIILVTSDILTFCKSRESDIKMYHSNFMGSSNNRAGQKKQQQKQQHTLIIFGNKGDSVSILKTRESIFFSPSTEHSLTWK